MDWYPLRFHPIYKERVWGGRGLEERFGRRLPAGVPIGESWEITDRPEGVSVVANGPLAGQGLDDLTRRFPEALLGEAPARDGRFPLLIKILDARDVLSLQVHPPAVKARELGGQPKTEMWYFTAADPGARIYAGLRPGISRVDFEACLDRGRVADCFHQLAVSAGDAMFLPSGRVHALGAGLMLFEVQENSDTTYRVYDWDRPGLDGRPRTLHLRESLESIDFDDVAPGLLSSAWEPAGTTDVRRLVDDPPFRVEVRRGRAGAACAWSLSRGTAVGVVRGVVEVSGGNTAEGKVRLAAGDFTWLPAALGKAGMAVLADAEWLLAEPVRGR